MPGKRIVIIGGGFGGAAAARMLRELLEPQHQVTLVDRSRKSYLCGSFPLLIVGERNTEQVTRSLDWLHDHGVRLLETEAQRVDTEARTVATANETLEYDYLVLSPGAVYDWDVVPGSRAAYSFYNLETAQRLRERLSSFRRGRVVIAVASLPYKCPPAPFETALVMDWAFRQRDVRDDIELHVFTPEPQPLGVAGPQAAAKLLDDMQERGVQVHKGVGIKEVGASGREAAFSDGSTMDADLIITVPAHRAPALVRSAGLVGDSGWVQVDPRTMESRVPGVYAIGDVNVVMMANGRPMPKAGVFASTEGETAARNIAAAINGTEPSAFPGVGYCFILYGAHQAGMVRGEFLASERPNVSMEPPTPEGYQAKERFEDDWRSFRI